MTSYYQEVLHVTEDYLGPASKRFLDRQIALHCKHPAAELTEEDVDKIADSVRVSLGLLTEDKTMVASAEKRLRAIAHPA